MGSYKMCLCFTRKFRAAQEADPPADVREAFAHYAAGGPTLTPDQLLLFLRERQGDQAAAIADAEAAVDQIRHRRRQLAGRFSRAGLSLDEFHHLLFDADLNPPLGAAKVHQDMTAPLSHYYIFTGHNSYLTGNQLSSDCSDVPIIKALKRGVRVIELDIWPNSAKDNVDVLHGRTLTSPVELIKCLKSIKEHAFVASPYPVVITLEDHLTHDLQAKVAEMISQTFGAMLFTPEVDCLSEFPSPESLKNRIIISTKPPKEYLVSSSVTEPKNGSQRVNDKEEEAWGKEVVDVKAKPNITDKVEENDTDDDDESPEDNDAEDEARKFPAPEYKRLITIRAGKPKGGLEEALKVDPHTVRRLSLSEPQLEKASESHGADLVRFTQRNMLRIYPKGTRVTSTNYNPLIGWMHGAQMVAFNMQGYGRYLWLMHGMFKANGGCGYIKKPDFLMKVGPNNEVYNPNELVPVKKILKIKIYMGDGWRLDFKQTHFDTYSPPDFYVKVGIAGVDADSQMKKTKTIEDDWTPVWDEEFTFPLTVPELALLRVEVHEYDMSEKDDFGGQSVLPVAELKSGIRAVSLFDRKGEKYKSVKLLMRFEWI